MDVLAGIATILLGGALLLFTVMVLSIFGFILYMSFPAIAGLIVGIWIWWNDHDNIGMLVILAGFVGQFFWMKKVDKNNSSSSSSFGSMSGKAKIYNKSGDVVGYQDRD